MTGSQLAIVIVLLLAAAAIVYLVRPILRAPGSQATHLDGALSEARELQSQRDMVVAALRDLEEDRATDKIDEADYDEIKNRLTVKAVELMKRLDASATERELAARPGPRPLPRSDGGQTDSGA